MNEERKKLRFSQREGYTPVRENVQKENFDQDTKNKMWNVIHSHFSNNVEEIQLRKGKNIKNVCNFICSIYSEILIKANDEIPEIYKRDIISSYTNYYYFNNEVYSKVRELFFDSEYYIQLDIIELFVQSFNRPELVDMFNKLFKEMLVGYRITESCHVIPINSETELDAINKAMKEEKTTNHIQQAVELLSNRKNPNYTSSIGESIKAVEQACRDIIGNKKTILSKCLNVIGNHIEVHPRQIEEIKKLSAWADTAARHAGDSGNVKLEDAVLTLVKCSAWVNFLKEKQLQANNKK